MFNKDFGAMLYFCCMKCLLFGALASTGLLIMSCSGNNDTSAGNTAPQSSVASLSYTVGGAFPHDTSHFTQGLAFYGDQLLEGTGNYGASKLLQLDLSTGKSTREVALPKEFFGEGITILNDTVYQLTWKENKVFAYTAKDFKKVKEFSINTEGWGITHNGSELIVSDGSSNLYFYEPSTFRLMRTQGVTEDGSPAVNLNELEYINGHVYANQWQYNYILKIDPRSGQVVGKMDLSELHNRAKAKNPSADVLNGIAFNPVSKKVYVTGKDWPEIYELQFNP
ncbi:MAG TPA: glutaminyl-peptide cyclotransferase [Chitinophagaceae bacterium]